MLYSDMTYKEKIVRIAIVFLVFIAMAAHSLAQTLKAQFEEVNGYYRLSFVVNSTDASGFTLPSLPDFEQRSEISTSTSSSYQIINGHASHSESTTYTIILSARRSGKVKIGPASVRIGGRVVKSAPIIVNIQAGQSGGGQSSHTGRSSSTMNSQQTVQPTGSAITQRDLFIDVTPSRTKVREQEAVLITYKVHSRIGVGLSNTSLTHKPDFKDIISQEIPLPGNQIETSIEQRAGGTYRTGTILQYVVFPQRSGKINIPGISFNCTVVQQDASLDLIDAFFNGGGTIGVNVTRNVNPITLDVQALPMPKPADFSGAVGKFSIKGSMLNPTIRTNDVATYRIILHGVGNMKLITPPIVSFPKDFDTYDAKTNENTKVTAQGLNGEVTFDYTFVPRNVGKYTIPAVRFTYFDTEKDSYQTIGTQPITLDVAQGERSNGDVERQLALLKSDIRDIHSDVKIHSRDNFMLTWGSTLYFVLQSLLLFLFAAMCILLSKYIRRMSDVNLQRRRGAIGSAGKRLKRAADLLFKEDESREFYAEISKALRGYISDKLNIPLTELSKERIDSILEQRQIDESLREKLQNVLGECELAQFAPSSDNSKQEVYDEAVNLIKSIKL